MRIAFISDTVYPYFKGGKEERLRQISTRLAKRGHDVHIYTMHWWKGTKVKKENGVTLHAISPYYPLYTTKGKRSIKEALGFAWHILPALRKEKFDIIDADVFPHTAVIPSWLISKIKRKPFFVTWHEYWGKYWLKYYGLSGIFGNILEKIALTLSSNIISVSLFTSKRIRSKRTTTIPNGIDMKDFKSYNSKTKKWDIAYVGRLISHKNVDKLIKIANKKKYKTIIMGKGPMLEELKELAGPTVTVAGFVKEDKEVFKAITQAKTFVTLSEREGFGITILQAFACGTPVITLDHEDNAGKDLIKHKKNGMVVKLDDKEIINAIEHCKKNSTMRKEAKKSAQKYDWDKIVDAIEKLYKKR